MAENRETRQKKIIENEFKKINFFFTAEDLYKMVVKIDRGIGIATVYRFLKDLKKNRDIHSYNCDRKSLYSTKKLNHNHFVCEVCGKKDHIMIDKVDFLKNFTSGEICHFQIEINGVCPSCKSKVYK